VASSSKYTAQTEKPKHFISPSAEMAHRNKYIRKMYWWKRSFDKWQTCSTRLGHLTSASICGWWRWGIGLVSNQRGDNKDACKEKEANKLTS
jgi:hypothetical protein